jgi:cytochrome c-type biogenesis protein CcmH/NrfG
MKNKGEQMRKSIFILVVLTLLIVLLPPLSVPAQEQQPSLPDQIKQASEDVKANPHSADAYYKLGNAYFQSGLHMQEAADAFSKAIQLYPGYVEAFVGLGRARDFMDEITEAIQAFHQAIKLDPNCLDAHLELGDLLLSEERFEEAATEFQNAVKIDQARLLPIKV